MNSSIPITTWYKNAPKLLKFGPIALTILLAQDFNNININVQ